MIFIVFVSWLFFIFLLSLYKHVPDKIFYVNCVIIVLLVGLRGYDVGSSDTIRYVDSFMGKSYTSHDTRETEFGYLIYLKVMQVVLPIRHGALFLITSAFLSLFPLFYYIKKESENVYFSLLGVFTYLQTIETVYFVCLRQILGMAIVLTSIILFYRVQGRVAKWFCIIVGAFLGWSFHTAALLMSFFFVLLYNIRIPRYVYAGILLLSYVWGVQSEGLKDLSFLYDVFFNTMGLFERLSVYADVSSAGSLVNNSYLSLLPTVFGCLIALFATDEKFHHFSCKMYFVGIIVFNLFNFFSENYRLTALFNVFGLVAITYTLKPILKCNTIVKKSFALLGLGLFLISMYISIAV